MAVQALNFEDFGRFLEAEGVHEDIISAFAANRICGQTFLALTEDDLKELVPVIGDRVRVREVLQRERKALTSNTSSPVTTESSKPEIRVSTQSSTVQPTATHDQSSTVQSTWHLQFHIPELDTFSGAVKDAVKTGVVTSVARREIVQVLRTYITQHTIRPTSEQYVTVCQKLIGKFPNLKDTEGDSPFATWRLSLRNSFKNFRRKGSNCEKGEPPSKRMKLHIEDDPEISEEEYEDAVRKLKEELRKGGKKTVNHSTVKHLMQLTRMKRCQWIQKDRPLILEVVEKFPCLLSAKWVRREFQAILQLEGKVTSLMDTWVEWSTKILEFSKTESLSRPYIKKRLKALEEAESYPYPDEYRDAVHLELLSHLMFPRGLGKDTIFIKQFETCDVDLDSEVSEIAQAAPFIVITGISGEENSQIFICSEKTVFLESKTIMGAVIDLISFYFVYDIAYPKYVDSILMFFQHYVFRLIDKQPVPAPLIKLIGNLKKF